MATREAPVAVRNALEALAQPRAMRRGSLSKRYMKCNKPGCRCSEQPEARHGPYFSLTRGVAGSTRSRLVSAKQAEIAGRQVAAGQRFRQQLEAYWRACEEWADMELEAPEATSREAAQRGGSRRPSTRKSRPRSRRS